MNFTDEELKIIYNSVKYYQMNRVPLTGLAYETCNSILHKIYPPVENK